MTSSALPIIEEFLRAAVPQQRKNALTALAIVGDEASVRMLAQSALGDDDEGVRAHALDEIASLGEEKAAAAVGVFEKELQGTDRAKQVRAYAVLGQLQSKSAYEANIRLPLGRRLLLAASLYKHIYLVKNLDFRLRSWRTGLLGSVAGSLSLIPATAWLYLSHPTSDPAPPGVTSVYPGDPWSSARYINYILGVLLVIVGGAIVSMIASQRTTPINLHVRRFAALPVEMLTAALLGFIGIVGYYAVLSPLLPIPIERKVETLGFMALAGLMAGVIRATSVLTFGLYINPKVNWLAETLAGAAAGFILVAVVVFYATKTHRLNLDEARYVSMGSIPFAVACASAFASIDFASPPGGARPGRSSLLVRILFFPAVIALSTVMGFALVFATQY